MPVAGQLGNWSDDFRLTLANELTGDRPWLGELHLIAIYGRALTAEEITRNFAVGVSAVVNYAMLLPPASPQQVDFVKDVQPLFRNTALSVMRREMKKEGSISASGSACWKGETMVRCSSRATVRTAA